MSLHNIPTLFYLFLAILVLLLLVLTEAKFDDDEVTDAPRAQAIDEASKKETKKEVHKTSRVWATLDSFTGTIRHESIPETHLSDEITMVKLDS